MVRNEVQMRYLVRVTLEYEEEYEVEGTYEEALENGASRCEELEFRFSRAPESEIGVLKTLCYIEDVDEDEHNGRNISR